MHQYLSKLGKVGVTEKAFKEKLYELWFEPYTRVAKNDSSGFEHVFMGEEVRPKIDTVSQSLHCDMNCLSYHWISFGTFEYLFQ